MNIKIQLAIDTDKIIIDYLSSNGVLNNKEATDIYNACVRKGKHYGTSAFDNSIELVLETLGLDAEELVKLTNS